MTNDVQVAISHDFLTAYANIPKNEQKKVADFISKFQQNPRSPGIHYEPIETAQDKNLKSVRIDQDYRGIVHHAGRGRVFLLLWVDVHDKAYDWALRKRCEVNRLTGTLQVFDVVQGQQTLPPSAEPQGLFGAISSSKLQQMGVPEDLVEMVKGLAHERQLDARKSELPQEAYEALKFIASGESVDTVIQELFSGEEPISSEVDPEDFESALSKPGTLQQFMLVDPEKEQELQDMLSAPMEKWRVFLHRSQRKVVERDFSGPARVLGGAGTGKTVVAMHRARWLAQNVFTRPSDRILFTTFTRNLAQDIESNLKRICPPDVFSRIEVVNIDRWALQFAKRFGYDYYPEYSNAKLADAWDEAIGRAGEPLELDGDFFQQEWEQVILANDVTTLEQYLRVPRTGRGNAMYRSDRKKVWNVVEAYRGYMEEKRARDIGWLMMDVRALIAENRNALSIRSVIVDEGQDLGPQPYRLLREIAGDQGPNDLFIVGDAHQRIYERKVSLKQCGIHIQGRSSILKLNYRTPEQTRDWAMRILQGEEFDDLDDGVDDGKGYRSLFSGPQPQLENFPTQQEELEFIVSVVKEQQEKGTDIRDICLVARTNAILREYKEAFRKRGLETFEIKQSAAEDRSRECIRIATMHRVKGLEFEVVLIASANDTVIPLDSVLAQATDPIRRNDLERVERSLLYVAATRARSQLLVTSFGKPSR
ncbi:MAG TPA: 3'-5' exonuclease, partial [Thermotogota bacterium]|nr:3'-5' exonuclease [Thermotogota bacterium]